ncbi:MAG TPA: amidohydrolase family protein, partial [Burkholderiales bacterium]|nr:amidohydrolase family protein [Burkholderiales bacterium]
TARQIYLRTLIGAIEALRSGTTTVVDDLNIAPQLDPEHLAAAHRAYEDIGLRALVGISMMDKPFFQALPHAEEEFPDEVRKALAAYPRAAPEQFLALCRRLARERHPRERRVGFIVAPSAPQRCTEGFLREARRLADEFDLPMIIHVQETRLQVVTGLLQHGKTFVRYLSELGFLKPKTSLVHAVWLDAGEIRLLAESGASVQHNPWSNLRIGSGVAPVRELIEAGVNLALGSDGCASTDTCNMLTTVSSAAALAKLRGDDFRRWPGVEEIWRAGTVGGATALGLGDRLGRIEEGMRADLVLYRTDSVAFTPLHKPLQQLVYAERGASVDTVIVDGEAAMRAGKLTRIDEPAILAEVREEIEKLRPTLDEMDANARRMWPPTDRIYQRCLAHPIPGSTHAAKLPG